MLLAMENARRIDAVCEYEIRRKIVIKCGAPHDVVAAAEDVEVKEAGLLPDVPVHGPAEAGDGTLKRGAPVPGPGGCGSGGMLRTAVGELGDDGLKHLAEAFGLEGVEETFLPVGSLKKNVGIQPAEVGKAFPVEQGESVVEEGFLLPANGVGTQAHQVGGVIGKLPVVVVEGKLHHDEVAGLDVVDETEEVVEPGAVVAGVEPAAGKRQGEMAVKGKGGGLPGRRWHAGGMGGGAFEGFQQLEFH